MTITPITSLTPTLRASVEARLSVLEVEVAREFYLADMLAGYSDDHRAVAARKQAEVDRLTDALGGMS